MTSAIATPVELELEHADLVSATLPLIGANIDEITADFYRRLFEEHPELLRNLFNRGNQAQGAQQRALAASIATFAAHLVDPELPHPTELLSRIGHKHASLGITADQYPIVHRHLFAAIVAVLGADTVTDEVAAAWDRVYWIMADTLIELEHDLYAEAGVSDGDVYRRARVASRVDDPSGAVLLTVCCDDEILSNLVPGQYVSLGVTLPDGARQLRQYSLVEASMSGELTFAVKPVDGTQGQPNGEVSTWIAANICVGDIVDVTLPFGDLPAPAGGQPLVLISAGIGITPMIGILEFLKSRAPGTPVQVLHADRSDLSHPMLKRQEELLTLLPNGTFDVWYEDAPTTGHAGVHTGFLTLDGLEIPDRAQIYLCGSNGFVQMVRSQLAERGVPAAHVHCELFAPNEWRV